MKSALDKRHGLGKLQWRRTRAAIFLLLVAVATVRAVLAIRTVASFRPVSAIGHGSRHNGRAVLEQRFITDELVTILLEDGAGERLSSEHEDGLPVFFELVDEGNEIAVAAHHGKGVDVCVSERHFESVESKIDIRAVLVAAR